jgi:hypothetical protein
MLHAQNVNENCLTVHSSVISISSLMSCWVLFKGNGLMVQLLLPGEALLECFQDDFHPRESASLRHAFSLHCSWLIYEALSVHFPNTNLFLDVHIRRKHSKCNFWRAPIQPWHLALALCISNNDNLASLSLPGIFRLCHQGTANSPWITKPPSSTQKNCRILRRESVCSERQRDRQISLSRRLCALSLPQ